MKNDGDEERFCQCEKGPEVIDRLKQLVARQELRLVQVERGFRIAEG
jgi:hypothetical protein